MNDAIDKLVSQFLRRGREAWPDIDLADSIAAGDFLDKIGAEPLEVAPSLHAEDMYLACACAAGNAVALAAFDARYLGQVKVFLGRMKPPPTLIEEVKQALRVRLLVPAPGGLPRIAEYSGRGTLSSWLRVAAIRLAIGMLKEIGAVRPPLEDTSEPMLDHLRGDDPELEVIKERYRDEVNQALRDAFSALSAEQRNLLRLSYRDGRSIDEIGALMAAHRATVARWIADARETILDETRRRLQERLRVTPAELQSLIRLLRSQLYLSVSRLLRDEERE